MHNVCSECGRLANYATCMARYGHPPKKEAYDVSTFSKGVCHYCKRETYVTEERDFFYPNYKLINWASYRKELNGHKDRHDD